MRESFVAYKTGEELGEVLKNIKINMCDVFEQHLKGKDKTLWTEQHGVDLVPCPRCGCRCVPYAQCLRCYQELVERVSGTLDSSLQVRKLSKRVRQLIQQSDLSETEISRVVHLGEALKRAQHCASADFVPPSLRHQLIRRFVEHLLASKAVEATDEERTG